MAKKTFPNGLVVEYPDGLRLRDDGSDQGGLRAFAGDEVDETGDVLGLIAESTEFASAVSLEVEGAVVSDRLAAMEEETSADEVTIRQPLGDEELAVILSECDGVLRWEYPVAIEEEESEPGGLGAAPAETRKVAVFRSRYRPVVDEKQKPEGFGFVGDFLLKPVKKLILRFTARRVGEAASKFLERNVEVGPILFSKKADEVTWGPVDSFSQAWSGGGPRRVLLFVHGTFSSVDGSFGGLLTTAEGSEFLSRALDEYDAVIGYDHKTLTETVKENALDLQQALKRLPDGEVTLDAIAYSRGGLVLRYLTEDLMPAMKPNRFQLRRAVFVACTNNGTKLADPEHWKELLDLYTNLVSAAGRMVGMVGSPSVALTSKIATGALRGALSFVQYLVSEATAEDAVPGLASMSPSGDDVKYINREQTDQPKPNKVDYFVIDANFDHQFFDNGGLSKSGLTQRLFLEFSDRFIERLFQGVPNDLVVDRESMSLIDPWAPQDWIQDRLGFEHNDGVYHTVYFNHRQVATKLAEWLL